MPNGSRIPFFGLDRQYANLQEEITEVTNDVLKTGKVLGGEQTRLFEIDMRNRLGRAHAIVTNSCSQALLSSYVALSNYVNQSTNKVTKVALPAISFVATANAPMLCGMEPVYIDVDDNGIMDLQHLDIRKDGIDIVSYVNLFGNVIDYHKLEIMTKFFHSEVPIIEDAAQSFGASYKGIPSGKLGTISCLSFDPTKGLANYGSGGMVLTDDDEIADFVASFTTNGKVGQMNVVGTNSKMSEVDCAQMRIKLKYFDEWQKRRTQIAEYYNSRLSQYVLTPQANPDVVHAWSKYVIHTVDHTKLFTKLTSNGIEVRSHYTRTLPSMKGVNMAAGSKANDFVRTTMSLPIYPELLDSEVERVCDLICRFYEMPSNSH